MPKHRFEDEMQQQVKEQEVGTKLEELNKKFPYHHHWYNFNQYYHQGYYPQWNNLMDYGKWKDFKESGHPFAYYQRYGGYGKGY